MLKGRLSDVCPLTPDSSPARGEGRMLISDLISYESGDECPYR